jgi:transcriptional regulator
MSLYVPPHFRVDDEARLAEFVERHAFGTLVTSAAAGLQVSHIPFLPQRGPDGRLRLLGHLARANAHWRSLEAAEALLVIFHGPHAYVSPSWYAQQPSVPTWNYAVVHAHGKARLMDEAELHELLVELSNAYEAHRPAPWRAGELPADYVATMLRAIVGFAIEVERLEGKFKLSQNRPAEVPRVAEALEREGEGALAALMRGREGAPRE